MQNPPIDYKPAYQPGTPELSQEEREDLYAKAWPFGKFGKGFRTKGAEKSNK